MSEMCFYDIVGNCFYLNVDECVVFLVVVCKWLVWDCIICEIFYYVGCWLGELIEIILVRIDFLVLIVILCSLKKCKDV